MAKWVYIHNNKVSELHDYLPVNWRNISNLNKSEENLEFLKSIGWLPVKHEHQTYDDTLYQIIDYDYEITNDFVIETLVLQPKAPPPAGLDVVYKQIFLTELRNRRDYLLSQSDWSQLIDVQSLMNSETKQKWTNYRQQLRDLPEVYSPLEFVDINAVVWPTIV